jgi:hypothetical protein
MHKPHTFAMLPMVYPPAEVKQFHNTPMEKEGGGRECLAPTHSPQH